MEQPTVSGRDRVNMNGLLNAFDVTDVIAHDCESLNAQSTWVYRNKAEFRLVIKKFFAKIGDYREELELLLTLKFRLVNSQTISFWLYIHLPALASPIKPLFKSPHTIWCERSHHLIRALTPFDVNAHIKWCEITFSAFRKDFMPIPIANNIYPHQQEDLLCSFHVNGRQIH